MLKSCIQRGQNPIVWHIARQVVERALESGKAVVVEDLQKVPKGRRGDGLAKLRRKLHKWVYRSVLEKIEVYARKLSLNRFFSLLEGNLHRQV